MPGLPAEDSAAPGAPKADPEALVLRARPRPVVRFRRGLIVAITGGAAASLAALSWIALQPASFRLVPGQEAAEPLRTVPPDALADAPATYADVPRLGPPLPGDLGRPVLEHQASPDAEPGRADAAADVRARAESERQRLAAAERAALAAGVMVPLTEATAAREKSPSAPAAPAAPAASPTGESAGQQRKIDVTRSSDGDLNPNGLLPPPSPWTLSAGTIIPASLLTGLNSDLPGMVIAQVTANVFDSATGRTLLIPQGARLIGSYDSLVAYGQRRALLVWQRILFPDGSSLRLDNMPATDLAGYAGLEDKVDFHSWRLLKGIALSTLLGVGSELSLGSGEGDLVRAVRESAQQNGARAGDQIISRDLAVQPTLTVRPGWPVRAIIHNDLVLRPWRG